MSIRNCLKTFFKQVHPDLLSHAPVEARSANTRAVQELNAYIDRLESPDPETYPTVARELRFFKRAVSRCGKPLPTMRPCSVSLPSIAPGADFFEKESIAVRVIATLEKAIAEDATLFSKKPDHIRKVEPIISSPTDSARKSLNDLWQEETKELQIKLALFESDDLQTARREAAKRFAYQTQISRLSRKYSSIKNPRVRNMKLSMIQEKAKKTVLDKFGPDKLKPYAEEMEVQVACKNKLDFEPGVDRTRDKARVIESGYHPDLVFFAPDLNEAERATGIKKVCGIGLSKEEDLWLLENVWKVMRSGDPAVPIVLGRSYSVTLGQGFITIPFDFVNEALVDFLEEHLDTVRLERAKLIKEARI